MPEIIIQDSQATMERLAGLLIVRYVDTVLAPRPIDRRTAQAKLDGAADAVARLLNGWGPEQVLTRVEEATRGWQAQEGREAFNARRQELVLLLFELNRTENRVGLFQEI